MNLMATQAGTVKKAATADAKITVPCFQTIDITSETTYTLSHQPKDSSAVKAYVLNGDGTLGAKVEIKTTAAKKDITISDKTVTIINGSEGYATGDQLFFMYEYEADGSTNNGAVEVVNSATNFPVGCKFIMEILGCDVCDQTELIYAYLVFNNAKLSPDFDWTIATDSTHPFSMKAMQDLKLSHRSIAA